MILYSNGSALINGRLIRADIAAHNGKIIAVAETIVPDDGTETVDLTGKYILPALIDIHTHGADGEDFNVSDKNGMRKIVDFYASHGVGTVLPTVLTDTDETICRRLKLIAELSEEYAEIKGIHLEGPFLSSNFCGAMPKHLLQNPDFEKFCEYQTAAKGLIRLVTVAPELPGALSFIKKVSDSGVIVSLGHSGADFDTTVAAISAGAKSFTHWGNAMLHLNQHEAGVAGAALLSECYCEVIADGLHVDKNVIKLLLKTKGVSKIVGVTDSIMAAGLSDGAYKLGINEVTVKNGDARLTEGGARAGSTLTADRALANFISMCGVSLSDAIKFFTENPAKLLNIYNRVGSIEVGKDADFLILP